jgi:glycosyltransferase involved in cell wall biosynthesis
VSSDPFGLPDGARVPDAELVIVVDWFARVGGLERILAEVARLVPAAPILTLFHERGAPEQLGIDPTRVRRSYLGRLPGSLKLRRFLLPFFADAVQSLDVGDARTVLSVSHAVAKNVPHRSWQRHVSYICSPIRYAHDLMPEYVRAVPPPLRPVVRSMLRDLAVWDVTCSAHVDAFAALSRAVAERVWHSYRRRARVIFPPVNLAAPKSSPATRGDYYVVLSRLVAYKRIDVAIRAAAIAGRRLVVIGDGPEAARLRTLARKARAASLVEFTGFVGEERVSELLAGARALLFPGEEDLGLVGVEAHAAGTPVVALGRGGMLDVLDVADGPWTDAAPRAAAGGVIVGRSTPEDFARGMLFLEDGPPPDAAALRALARRFNVETFREQMANFVEHPGTD